MKQVLLSADGEISVYCVPDAVADDLETYWSAAVIGCTKAPMLQGIG